MEEGLRATVLKVEGEYLHFGWVKKNTHFGCHAVFRSESSSILYDVLLFSQPLLQVNTLTQHLAHSLTLYRALNSKIVTPVLAVLDRGEALFVVSRACEHSLGDLVRSRQGLSEFQIAYFLRQLLQLTTYLRQRECVLEKLEMEDIGLTADLKLTVTFSLFLSGVGARPVLRRLPFRSEYRNRNNCPDLFLAPSLHSATLDPISAWNIGVLLFQLLHNALPFPLADQDLLSQSKSCRFPSELAALLQREHKLVFPQLARHPQLGELVRSLLNPHPSARLKLSLVVLHPFLQQFPSPPHILPATIFSCPPSQAYQEAYFRRFHRQPPSLPPPPQPHEPEEGHSHTLLPDPRAARERPFRTQAELQESQRTLSESLALVEEFVDISDSFGVGYQMSSGSVCFLFNDESEFWWGGGREVRARRGRSESLYQLDKLPEEEELRKKIHILEAFARTLRRPRSSSCERGVSVVQYCRSKYAALFLLSNDAVQVFFNDKVNFLLGRDSLHIQLKNSDHYELQDFAGVEGELEVRREYCLTMARKLFLWQSPLEQHILDTDGLIFD